MLSFKILCQIIFAFYLLTKNNLSSLVKLQFIFSDFLNYSMAFAFSLLLLICLGTSRGEKDFIVLLWDQKSDLSLGWLMGDIFCSVLIFSQAERIHLISTNWGTCSHTIIDLNSPYYFTLLFPLISNLSAYLPQTKGKKNQRTNCFLQKMLYFHCLSSKS